MDNLLAALFILAAFVAAFSLAGYVEMMP